MNLILSICDKSYVMQIFLIVKLILALLCYLVPIIIIITSAINFFKSIKSGKDEDLKENGKVLLKKVIAGLVVMLIPTIFPYLFSNLVNGSGNDIMACLEAASLEKVESLRAQEEKETEEKKKAEDAELNKKVNEKNEEEKAKNEAYQEGLKSKVKNLNYISQGNYSNLAFCANGSTVANSGCGAADFAMVTSSYSDPKYNMEYVASWFCNNKYSQANGALRGSAVLDADTLQHFGLEGGVLFGADGSYGGSSYNESNGNAVLNAVQSGKAVMIGIPKHWILAGPNESCSSNQVYLYDSGFPSRNGCYTPSELFQVTYNSRNHCTNEGICGWDIGIVLS